MQMDERLACEGGHTECDVLASSQRRTGNMGLETRTSGWCESSLRAGSSIVVLLSGNICERHFREDDTPRDDLQRGLLLAERSGKGKADLLASITLTDGDRLALARRRLGWTQSRAARKVGYHRNTYCDFENSDKVTQIAVPHIDITSLHDREICWLLRRRKKWTQGDLAERAGISRYWINRMETGDGPCDKLSKFWGI